MPAICLKVDIFKEDSMLVFHLKCFMWVRMSGSNPNALPVKQLMVPFPSRCFRAVYKCSEILQNRALVPKPVAPD